MWHTNNGWKLTRPRRPESKRKFSSNLRLSSKTKHLASVAFCGKATTYSLIKTLVITLSDTTKHRWQRRLSRSVSVRSLTHLKVYWLIDSCYINWRRECRAPSKSYGFDTRSQRASSNRFTLLWILVIVERFTVRGHCIDYGLLYRSRHLFTDRQRKKQLKTSRNSYKNWVVGAP